ncbi:branched-chain amino acid ABC transporter permease [Bradyrhizobium sp. AUGA SZCCT0222]|uniref:branched-chain amino acid ABC transporter permease n=1 Tax=Bradyrhizobium sp. AUGA SZCCT0222 TaxID=2807668 RepID=UPI001BA56937|nr:branched-chain amino acid ABC transporter permease [Bradyrhizobium sp. AUGA SZCCT0222]MBR1267095.1 branched-chain amino acid ABC transporter permease [Bradyrhizobium sp. AUGA SZCCT0222]
MTWRPTNTVGVVALIAIAIIFPLIGSAAAVTVMALGGLYAIVAIGLNLLVGYTGKISFGHNAFMAIGAYTTGILTVRYDWSPLSALIAAAAGTGLVAFIIGAPILRVRGHYLAMITLAFSQIVILVSTRWTEVTGGLTGIPGVPDFAIAGFTFDTKLKMYYLIWGVAIVLLLLSFRIVDSRFGRALRALGAHETAAGALGVDVVRCRIQIFVLSAVFAALAGSLYAHLLNYVNGTFFDLGVMIQLMAILVVGGIGTLWGPVVGAVLLIWVSQNLGSYAEYSQLIFGLLYGGALLFLPGGVVGEVAARLKR